MTLTRDEVLLTALLARVELGEEEIAPLQADLAAILGYVATLDRLDTTGIEPTTHAVPLDCPLRPDDPAPHLPHDEALAAAPATDDGCFVVPAIITAGAPEAAGAAGTGGTAGTAGAAGTPGTPEAPR